MLVDICFQASRDFAATRYTRGMSTGLGDFAPLQPAPTVAGACKTVAGASVSAEQGEKRKWLKIYETLPNQLLNAYGAAKCIKMSDSDMWAEMKRPLATGAARSFVSWKRSRGVSLSTDGSKSVRTSVCISRCPQRSSRARPS